MSVGQLYSPQPVSAYHVACGRMVHEAGSVGEPVGDVVAVVWGLQAGEAMPGVLCSVLLVARRLVSSGWSSSAHSHDGGNDRDGERCVSHG